MQRLKKITVENYRSIGEEPIEIEFPSDCPTILLGENNAGKSNIIRSIELLFGEYHPKYKKLDNYDHFSRDETNKISIDAEGSNFETRLGRNGEYSCSGFKYSCVKGEESEFLAVQAEDGGTNKYVSNILREELLCVT